MSKELTEQWREGTLPRGAYYVNRLNEIRIYLVTYEDDKNTHEIYEVLAPVPSYEEWKTAKENLDKNGTWYTERSYKLIEKKLDIAVKGLWFIYYQSDRKDMYNCAEGTLKQLEELEK